MSDSSNTETGLSARTSSVFTRSDVERHDLAESLLRRTDRVERARDAFRLAYPEAPEEMVNTATHHMYVDGPGAVVDWLADAELFLRDPEHRLSSGTTWHLLYHVYNWQQFQALLPDGREGMLRLKQFAEEGDLSAVKRTVQELADAMEGGRQPPSID